MEVLSKMKKFACVSFLLLLFAGPSFGVTDMPALPLNSAALTQPAGGEFTFAVFGDFRPSRRDTPYPEVFNRTLEELNIIAPSFVISTGDAYYGYGGTLQRFKNEIDYFMSRTKTIAVPFFNTIGNHEVTDSTERQKYAKERFGKFYSSMDFGASHFVILNTEEPGKEGSISGEQLAWLEKDLEANRDAANIFVFLHRPLFSAVDPLLLSGKSFKDKNNRDQLHNLFKRYRVKIVFAGHEHLFSDTVKDNVRYIITGGAGAPLYRSASEGGFFHYMIIKVKGRETVVDVLSPYALQVRRVSGNDGLESRAELEIVSILHTALSLKNVSFIMPAADTGRYRVKAVSISKKGNNKDHPAKIRQVKNNGDGTATVSVETEIPENGTLRVAVEADMN